jgi:hypothetical protein
MLTSAWYAILEMVVGAPVNVEEKKDDPQAASIPPPLLLPKALPDLRSDEAAWKHLQSLLYPSPLVDDDKDSNEVMSLSCPITGLIMCDPVSTSDGQVYEREAIIEWLWRSPNGCDTSPMTNLKLANKKITSNKQYLLKIREFLEKHPDLAYQQYLPVGWVRKMKEACYGANTAIIRKLVQRDKRLLLAMDEKTKRFPLHHAALRKDNLILLLELLENQQKGLGLASLLCSDFVGKLPLEHALCHTKSEDLILNLMAWMGDALASFQLTRPLPPESQEILSRVLCVSILQKNSLWVRQVISWGGRFNEELSLLQQQAERKDAEYRRKCQIAYNPRIFFPNPKTASSKLSTFLRLVAEGEQEKAEAMLKVNRRLALGAGTVTDLSNRTFKHITGFQYAVWAMDWHMWEMLLNWIPKEEVTMQLQALEENGTEHGIHFDLNPFIDVLDSYITKLKYHQLGEHELLRNEGRERIAQEQLLLPAHVVNEYCRPDRPFYPEPNFRKRGLPRVRTVSFNTYQEEWFSILSERSKYGYVYVRGNDPYCQQGGDACSPYNMDIAALRRLRDIRKHQLENLHEDYLPRNNKHRYIRMGEILI